MGAIADSVVAFAQPLIDASDGSLEQMQKALSLSQLCWNLAIMPEESREEWLREMQPKLNLDDDEFDELRREIIDPMIRRHEEMFPRLHRTYSSEPAQSDFARRVHVMPPVSAEQYPGTEPYAPCPCNSGKKYKFCCRATGR